MRGDSSRARYFSRVEQEIHVSQLHERKRARHIIFHRRIPSMPEAASMYTHNFSIYRRRAAVIMRRAHGARLRQYTPAFATTYLRRENEPSNVRDGIGNNHDNCKL